MLVERNNVPTGNSGIRPVSLATKRRESFLRKGGREGTWRGGKDRNANLMRAKLTLQYEYGTLRPASLRQTKKKKKTEKEKKDDVSPPARNPELTGFRSKLIKKKGGRSTGSERRAAAMPRGKGKNDSLASCEEPLLRSGHEGREGSQKKQPRRGEAGFQGGKTRQKEGKRNH